MNTSERRRRAAFTLIELLVVISVIAVLVSIVLPSLGTAREASRRAKCLANLRSIGQGFSMYLKDNKDKFPYVRPLHAGQSGTTFNDPSLLDLISDYLNAEVPRHSDPNDTNSDFIVGDPYKCPSDRPGIGGNGEDGKTTWEKTGCSYEYFPGGFMLMAEGLNLNDPAFGVTKAYEKDRKWPIALDWGDFHPVRRGHTAKNASFFPDYRADWMIDLSNSDLTKFIEDMVRYSGRKPPPPQ